MNTNKKKNGNGETLIPNSSENSRKKINRNHPGQLQESWKISETSIADLPPEMLTTILKCLDTRSLLKSRLVNRTWNLISSSILPTKSDAYVYFHFNGQTDESPWGSQERKNNLKEFLQCMKNSKSKSSNNICPYARFAFSFSKFSTELELFHHQDWIEFLSDFAPSRIRGLKLQALFLSGINSFQVFAGKLRDLLLNKIPRLEEITLRIECSRKAPDVKLFPIPIQTQIQIQIDTAAAVPVQFQFPQLPHLKVIRFECRLISEYTALATDLLNAAVNLKQLHVQINKCENFQFLHNLGKLHLVKEAEIHIKENFFSPIQLQNHNDNQQQQQGLNSTPFPKLEILNLYLGMDEHDQPICALAATFISNLFESNKNTLTTLKLQSLTCGFGCLPGFQLPTFSNLKHLGLLLDFDTTFPVFPQGSRARNIFPIVDSLDLKMNYLDGVPPEDSIPILPNLKTLEMKSRNGTVDVISTVALMCPSLVNLKIKKGDDADLEEEDEEELEEGGVTFVNEFYNSSHVNFLKVGRAIWIHMRQLESLEVDVKLDLVENNSLALDSCFTGISVENCMRLGSVMEAKETLEKWGCKTKVLESDLTAEREFPSILDMKELKTLTINPYSRKKQVKERDSFSKKLTWISQEYAFKLMPHLKIMKGETVHKLFN